MAIRVESSRVEWSGVYTEHTCFFPAEAPFCLFLFSLCLISLPIAPSSNPSVQFTFPEPPSPPADGGAIPVARCPLCLLLLPSPGAKEAGFQSFLLFFFYLHLLRLLFFLFSLPLPPTRETSSIFQKKSSTFSNIISAFKHT